MVNFTANPTLEIELNPNLEPILQLTWDPTSLDATFDPVLEPTWDPILVSSLDPPMEPTSESASEIRLLIR